MQFIITYLPWQNKDSKHQQRSHLIRCYFLETPCRRLNRDRPMAMISLPLLVYAAAILPNTMQISLSRQRDKRSRPKHKGQGNQNKDAIHVLCMFIHLYLGPTRQPPILGCISFLWFGGLWQMARRMDEIKTWWMAVKIYKSKPGVYFTFCFYFLMNFPLQIRGKKYSRGWVAAWLGPDINEWTYTIHGWRPCFDFLVLCVWDGFFYPFALTVKFASY